MTIAPAGIPSSQQFPLEHRKIVKKTVVAMIWFLILFFILLLVTGLLAAAAPTPFSAWLWTLFFLILALYIVVFILEIWYQVEYYKRYYYDIEHDFLVIKKGVIMPHQVMLPYEKLQDVYMDQDLFDRMFSLWDVHVSTATVMSGYAAHIDGVNQQNAEALRNRLLDKIRKKGG